MTSSRRKALSFVLVAVALAAAFFLAINAGPAKVGPRELVRGLFVSYEPDVSAAFDLCFPRAVIAMLAGACVAVSGTLLQAVTRNPLADPALLGVSGAATLVAVAVTALAPWLLPVTPLLAFVGGAAAAALCCVLSWREGLSTAHASLVGVALAATLAGVLSVVASATDGSDPALAGIVSGVLTRRAWGEAIVLVPYAGVGLVLAMVAACRCDLLRLGDAPARSLGLSVGTGSILVALVAVLLASAPAALMGPVAFLGLASPHLSRLALGSGDHRLVIPFAALLGALVMLLADTIGRTLLAPYEVAPAVIVAIVCAPAVVAVLRKSGVSHGR